MLRDPGDSLTWKWKGFIILRMFIDVFFLIFEKVVAVVFRFFTLNSHFHSLIFTVPFFRLLLLLLLWSLFIFTNVGTEMFDVSQNFRFPYLQKDKSSYKMTPCFLILLNVFLYSVRNKKRGLRLQIWSKFWKFQNRQNKNIAMHPQAQISH